MLVETCKSMYLVGTAVCIDEQLLPFRGRCAFWQYMTKKSKQLWNKIWMMCDCATKYVMNVKVYVEKKTIK